MLCAPRLSTLFPYTTLFRSLSSFFFISPWILLFLIPALTMRTLSEEESSGTLQWLFTQPLKISGIVWGKYWAVIVVLLDRKSTRLNSSHVAISYAVFCLKKK